MHTTQIRQADLNLLVVLAVLAEERNISRAAARLLLSQPAVSRALQRLRDTFHDDLLVRTAHGYLPTPHGQRVLSELEVVLPRLDRLIGNSSFDPATEKASFRIAATDNATHVLAPILTRGFLPDTGSIMLEFVAWQEGVFDALERGSLDLILNADDGTMPAQFHTEVIYHEEFVCVVDRDYPLNRRLTLQQYLAAQHIGITIMGGLQTIPEKRLAGAGQRRNCVLRMPYFAAAIRSVIGTRLIATLPKRFATVEANAAIKLLKPPQEMTGFDYLMAWHPRVNTDSAHQWLREIIRQTAKALK
jgi:DNA-binding transcriptional LysR family regulator